MNCKQGEIFMNESKIGSGRDENRVPLYKIVPLKVPFSIGIGASDFCNFKCKYCAQSTSIGITPQILSWDKFVDIISQIEELLENNGVKRIKNFQICGIGESLICKELPQMIRYVKERGISDRIELTTNGSLLTHELSKNLIDAGLTRLLISVQGINKEAYKKICDYDIDFEKFIDEIAYFYQNRQQCSVYIKTADVALKEGEDKLFYDIFSPIADMVHIEHIMDGFSNVDYTNMIEKHREKTRYGYDWKEKICCDSLFMRMSIASVNGDVNACGCQWPGLPIGNVYKKRLAQIWNGDAHKQYMKLHLSGNRGMIVKCRDCESISFAGHPMDDLDEHLDEILQRVNKL